MLLWVLLSVEGIFRLSETGKVGLAFLFAADLSNKGKPAWNIISKNVCLLC
jgi:hypothetical protein